MTHDHQNPDVLIAGGGPAGLACAIALGQAGLRVTVLDKTLGARALSMKALSIKALSVKAAGLDASQRQEPEPGTLQGPGDKVCGEGIMPLGLAELARLGLAEDDLPGVPFAGLHYHTPRRQVALPFPEGLRGRGIRRTGLLKLLAQRAAALPTVHLARERVRAPLWADGHGGQIVGLLGSSVTWRAPVVIAADGVHSPLLRQTPLHLRRQGQRYALRQHFRVTLDAMAILQEHGLQHGQEQGQEPLQVQVGLFAPWDVYLTPVGPEEVLATTMTQRAGYEQIRRDYAGFLHESPFGQVFRGAKASSPLLGWQHPLFHPQRYHVGGMLVVGDAGGGIDPCLGMGLSMALVSARHAAAAAGATVSRPSERQGALADFDAARHKLFNHYRYFGTLFRLLVASAAGAEGLVWAMEQWPRTAQTLLGCVAARHRWTRVRPIDLLQPLGIPRGQKLKTPLGAAEDVEALTGPQREKA